MNRIFSIILVAGTIIVANSSDAKVFHNAYISFEMPDSWKCNLEQTEWVCRSEQTKESKEAIIILTAKEVGPTDSIDLYEQHLNSALPVTNRNGSPGQSQIQYKSKKVQINNQMWIDGLHLGSEVPNYFTRYFATIKDKIAILVTFSAHKMYYSKYSQDFFKSIMSLRVIASKNLLTRPDVGPVRPGSEIIGSTIGRAMPMDMEQPEENSSGKSNSRLTYMALAALIGALGLYFFFKSKKK